MNPQVLRRLVVALGAAALVAGAAIAVSASSGEPRAAKPTVVPALFRGIPERDGVLGDPGAPVTITEFVDLQCPVCAAASHEVLPRLIEDYVRPGKVKLDARLLSFLGPDSERAARAAAGAQEQGRLWPFLHAFFSAQGAENSGYVTDEFLAQTARAAGADPQAVLEASDDGPLTRANSDAQTYGVTGTPTFLLADAAGGMTMLGSGVPDMDDLREQIEKALER